MHRRAILGVALSFAVAGAVAANAQSGSAKRGSGARMEKHLVFTDDAGVAINGYDTVAYFTAGRPTEGNAQYSTEWQGATWRFASAENLQAFQQNPAKYAPAYGGYCAWGVGAKNDAFPVDPTAWKIVDNRLFLNNSADVQQTWLQDVPGFIRSGDANWPGLVKAKGK